VEADQEHVQIVVTDTGVGIPAEDLPFVFRRFHRGRNAVTYPGSGLGLAIVKTIVDQHGGDLTIESNNEGTTATIILPKAE
jgi:signal transduction histidine kinase